MGWEPRVADDLAETPAPTDAELRLIREELDPGGRLHEVAVGRAADAVSCGGALISSRSRRRR